MTKDGDDQPSAPNFGDLGALHDGVRSSCAGAMLMTAVSVIPGCSSMVDIYVPTAGIIDDQHPQSGGSYYLAKHILQVTIAGTAADPTIAIAPIAVPDRNALMQLGLDLSAFADDDIQVTFENGLLKQIHAKGVDRTGDVLVALAKDLGTFRDRQTTSKLNQVYEFDPFDPNEARDANKFIARVFKKSCIEVELLPGIWSPGCAIGSLGKSYSGETIGTGLPMPSLPGVYYRRPVTHRVHVITGGQTSQVKYLAFANDAPLFRVDINRTLFVTRDTTATFDQGQLTNVSVSKGSEALAVANLPVQIFDAYIGGATDALVQPKKVQDATTANINAQTEQLKAEAGLAKTEKSIANGTFNSVPASTDLTYAGRSGVTQADCNNYMDKPDPRACAQYQQTTP